MAFQGRNDDFGIPERDDRDVSRDDRGRFVGCGNPKGRPRKIKLPPANSLSAALALELQKDVTIRMDGKQQTIPVFQAISAKLIHGMVSGSARDIIFSARLLEKLGALDLLDAVQEYKDSLLDINSEPGWTPELEARYRVLEHEYDEYVDDEDERQTGGDVKRSGEELRPDWDGART